MKKLRLIFFFAAVLSFGIFTSSCRSKQDPATYNNKLMTLLNKNEKDMSAMNMSMSAHNYGQAETVRKAWADNLVDELREANSIEKFQGNDAFKASIINGLKNYQKIVVDDYKQLIVIRSKPDNTQVAEENNLLNKINRVLQETENAANKASSDFETKFAK